MVYLVLPACEAEAAPERLARYPGLQQHVRLIEASQLLRSEELPFGAYVFTSLFAAPREQRALVDVVQRRFPPEVPILNRVARLVNRESLASRIAELRGTDGDQVVRSDQPGKPCESPRLSRSNEVLEWRAGLLLTGHHPDYLQVLPAPPSEPGACLRFRDRLLCGSEFAPEEHTHIASCFGALGLDCGRLDLVRVGGRLMAWRVSDGIDALLPDGRDPRLVTSVEHAVAALDPGSEVPPIRLQLDKEEIFGAAELL